MAEQCKCGGNMYPRNGRLRCIQCFKMGLKAKVGQHGND